MKLTKGQTFFNPDDHRQGIRALRDLEIGPFEPIMAKDFEGVGDQEQPSAFATCPEWFLKALRSEAERQGYKPE